MANSATNTYLANELNQYTAISSGIPVTPTYDDDGNMTSYNGWTYNWNGENRLILASNTQHVVEYAYDHIGRMAEKTSDGQTTRYLWDGFNIVAEIKTTNQEPGTTNVTYNVWGLDLSGTMQGAGGVGGLLAVARGGQVFAAAYDANGNITEYVDAAGNVAASRTYGPFGETTATTGPAGTFTHWWSTKPWDGVTGFNEYEYRMYSPGLGRWLCRDLIEESGGTHLYAYVRNELINKVDLLGLLSSPSINISIVGEPRIDTAADDRHILGQVSVEWDIRVNANECGSQPSSEHRGCCSMVFESANLFINGWYTTLASDKDATGKNPREHEEWHAQLFKANFQEAFNDISAKLITSCAPCKKVRKCLQHLIYANNMYRMRARLFNLEFDDRAYELDAGRSRTLEDVSKTVNHLVDRYLATQEDCVL